MLTVAPSINPGDAKNWMIYTCWLSQPTTGWFTSSRCRSKSTNGRNSRKKLDALPLLTVATRCLRSAPCRHTYQSWSCEKLNALHVLTVAININPVSGGGAWTGVTKSWSCSQLDVLQVLALATHPVCHISKISLLLLMLLLQIQHWCYCDRQQM